MVSLLGLPQIQQLRENSKAFSQSHGNLIKSYLIQSDLIQFNEFHSFPLFISIKKNK